jgi:hypothetical protein
LSPLDLLLEASMPGGMIQDSRWITGRVRWTGEHQILDPGEGQNIADVECGQSMDLDIVYLRTCT